MAASQAPAEAGRQGFLFGYPIKHSMSPMLHTMCFQGVGMKDHTYEPLESLDMDGFVARLRSGQCYGSAVTMPHKLAILKHLDELTAEAQSVGACNTVTVQQREGRPFLVGTNTDVIGIRESFYQNVPQPATVSLIFLFCRSWPVYKLADAGV